MAHLLEELGDGTAAFLGREDAWHKLGQIIGDAFDIDTMRERCPQLVMPVHMQPVFTLIDGEYVELPETGCTVREDGKIVGEGMGKDSYTIVQQEDVYRWAAQIAQLGDFPFISAATIREGRQFFATLDAGGFGLGGLRVQSHLTAFGSHDRSLHVGALYSNIVAVCANTFTAADRTATDRITIRHTASADDQMRAAVLAVEGVREFVQREQARFEELAAVELKLRTRRFDNALDAVLPSLDEKARGSDQREEAREAIRMLSKAPVVADTVGTGLGFVQAVNTFENWHGTVKGRRGRDVSVVRAERQFDAVVKGSQPLTRTAVESVLAAA